MGLRKKNMYVLFVCVRSQVFNYLKTIIVHGSILGAGETVDVEWVKSETATNLNMKTKFSWHTILFSTIQHFPPLLLSHQ